MGDYLKEAISDAAYTAENFLDEIVEQLIEKGKASNDLLNDYPDGDAYHHEVHTDKWYSLRDAAELLDELRDYEEDDSGLWEGMDPREAIVTMAAFTYGNAVYAKWQELIAKINDDSDIGELLAERQEAEEAEEAAGETNEESKLPPASAYDIEVRTRVEEIIKRWK